VLDDFELDSGQLEDLPALAFLAHERPPMTRRQSGAALWATGVFADPVLNHLVGRVALPQGIAAMPLLAAGLATGLLAQAFGFRRVAEVAFVGRGRLAARAAVAFKFGELRFQSLKAVQ